MSNYYEIPVDEGMEFLVTNYSDPELIQDPFDIVAAREIDAGIPLAIQGKRKHDEELSRLVCAS